MRVSGIEVTINRSRRKTVSIFVERDGSVSARVPEKLSAEEIEEVLLSKQYQIHRHLAEWTQLNERYVLREFVSGQSFLYLGRNYRLKLVDEALGELKFNQGKFFLGKPEIEKAESYFVDFYKRKLQERIRPLVKQYQAQLGVHPREVKVMELQHRWASCTATGNVNFHWKCAMAPLDVLHYIVVHELAHLIHLNHTPAFWNEVDKVLPNYEKPMNWLRLNGAGMDL